MSILEAGYGSGWASGFASGYQIGYQEGIEVLSSLARSFVQAIGDAMEADAALASLLAGPAIAGGVGGLPESMGFGSGWASGWASGFLVGSDPDAAAAAGVKKVWHELAPAKVDLPVISYGIVPGSVVNERVARWSSLSSGVLQVTSAARTWPDADDVARRAVAVLSQGIEDDTIRWRTGRLMELWPMSPTTPRAPYSAPGSGRAWDEVRQFKFMYSEEVL